MNIVTLIGRLTKDPDVKHIPGNQMVVATFNIAIDRPSKSGQDKKADFPRITVFGRQAENCEKFLSKGMRVGIQGRIQTGSYTNKDGQTVYTTDVVADRVEFLEWGDKQQSGDSQNRVSVEQNNNSQQQMQQTSIGENIEIPEGFQAIQDDEIPF